MYQWSCALHWLPYRLKQHPLDIVADTVSVFQYPCRSLDSRQDSKTQSRGLQIFSTSYLISLQSYTSQISSSGLLIASGVHYFQSCQRIPQPEFPAQGYGHISNFQGWILDPFTAFHSFPHSKFLGRVSDPITRFHIQNFLCRIVDPFTVFHIPNFKAGSLMTTQGLHIKIFQGRVFDLCNTPNLLGRALDVFMGFHIPNFKGRILDLCTAFHIPYQISDFDRILDSFDRVSFRLRLI